MSSEVFIARIERAHNNIPGLLGLDPRRFPLAGCNSQIDPGLQRDRDSLPGQVGLFEGMDYNIVVSTRKTPC